MTPATFLMMFIVTLLKSWLPAKQRALSWMLRGPIYAYECYKYITVRKNSSPNEIFYEFQLTSVKKKEAHGLWHVVEEN